MDESGLRNMSAILNEEVVKLAKRLMGQDMAIPLGISIGAVEVGKDGNVEEYDLLLKKPTELFTW